MSPLRWTSKSTRTLAAALRAQGYQVSEFVVRRLLKAGYSLQANAKTTEGSQHPDRDAQFGYLNDQAKDHQAAGCPVISVDTKKKELVGQYKNGGREWQPTGRARAGQRPRLHRQASWARPSRTASTTWPRTPAGWRGAPTTTPPRSPWPPSPAGGNTTGQAPTPAPTGC